MRVSITVHRKYANVLIQKKMTMCITTIDQFVPQTFKFEQITFFFLQKQITILILDISE
jgi:hypothetical protein